jgi:dienelactone hydrolase
MAVSDYTARSHRRSFLTKSLPAAFAGSSLFAARLLNADEQNRATVNQTLSTAMKQAELSMLFTGKTKAEFEAWQQKFRATLNKLLGDSTPPSKWAVVEEARSEEPDHVRYSLLLTAKGVASVPVYLLVPQGLKKGDRVPGVLCVHGHGEYGNDPIVGRRDLPGVTQNIEKHNYDYGLQFVRRGYVVAAPCMVPFGRRVDKKRYGSDPCAVTFVRMQALGKILITENLRDLRWSLDLLQSRPEVLAERLGCAGLSYGGRMTMMAAAIDTRIKVAAVSGALNLMQERMSGRYSCGAQVVPGLLKYGDYSEIGSLIAPRACVWETGSKDGLIVPKWDKIFRSRLHNAYAASGAADELKFDQFEGGHSFSGKIAMPVFDQVLKAEVE